MAVTPKSNKPFRPGGSEVMTGQACYQKVLELWFKEEHILPDDVSRWQAGVLQYS